MFLNDYFKKRSEYRAAKAAAKKAAIQNATQKKRYQELSSILADAIKTAAVTCDQNLKGYKMEYLDFPRMARRTYQVDEKLSVKILSFIPSTNGVITYEATFSIDGIPIKIDLSGDWEPQFVKLGKIVCDSLEKNMKEYAARKVALVDNYFKWKEEQTS